MTALLIIAIVLTTVGFGMSIMAENRKLPIVTLVIWVSLMIAGFVLAKGFVSSIVWLSFAVAGFIGGWALIDERQAKKKQ